MVVTQAKGMEGSGEMHYFGLTTNLSTADNFFEDNKLGQGDLALFRRALFQQIDSRI